jgi:beta-glucosidase
MDLEMPGRGACEPGSPSPKRRRRQRRRLADAEKVLAEVKAAIETGGGGRQCAAHFARDVHERGCSTILTPAAARWILRSRTAVALQGATESIVLLKNDGALLPLDAPKIRSVAVIGPNAAMARTGGGGSSLVRPKYAIAPLDGIKEPRAARCRSYALGVGMEGEDAAQDTPKRARRLATRPSMLPRKSDVAVRGGGPLQQARARVSTAHDGPAGRAGRADRGGRAGESAHHRCAQHRQPGDHDEVDREDAGARGYVVSAGRRAARAGLDSLWRANPSGKLPVSLPKEFKDSPAAANYPGENLKVNYAEGIYVGYRYYDTKNVEPLFPFGFGLSYTTFEYSDLKVTPGEISGKPVVVTLKVKNSGARAGAEVVQLYVHDGHSKIDRPAHELKGFRRVELNAGETKTVEFKLDRAAFSYWSPEKKAWVADPGTFEIQVGASSRDIRLKAPLELPHSWFALIR